MLNLKFLPVQFSLFMIVGIVLGYYNNMSLNHIFIISLILFSFLSFFYYRAVSSFNLPLFFGLITGVLFVLIGILNITMYKPKNQKKHYTNIYRSDDKMILEIDKRLKTSLFYFKYQARVIQVGDEYTKGKILIQIKKEDCNDTIKTGQIIFTKSTLTKINKALNPNEFDYRAYMRKQGVFHQIKLEKGNYKRLEIKIESINEIAFHVRRKINQKLKKYNFSKENLSLINALLLGQRQDISIETFNNFRNAGAIHILAVSGLHIGVILLLLNFLLKPLDNIRNGKKAKIILVVICLWFYALLAGMSASIVRAVSMFTAVAIGLAINRPSSIKNSLVVSIFFLLLFKPLLLFDVGFQLSYAAVFFIVWINPIFKKIAEPKTKIIRYFWQLLSISFAAQIGILPLSLYYFHQFPGLFFISNLFIIPFLGLILGLGILLIILALVNLLPQVLADLYELIIGLMSDVVTVVSQQESFIFQNISFSLLLMGAFYILILTTINWLHYREIKPLFYLFSSIIIVQITLLYEKNQVQKTREFIVFHQVKKTLIGIRVGNKLNLYEQEDSLSTKGSRIINSYRLKYSHLQIQKKEAVKNVMSINSKKLLIIDDSGVYKYSSYKPDFVLLTQSPKINLQRLIEEFHPKMIIADGSNYKSYTLLWEKTSKKNNTKFHSTRDDGAFIVSH